MLVAYQGIPGAYSEMAARELFPGCRALPRTTFADTFLEVCRPRGRAVAAVIPVENSLAGSIHENYDLLARHAPRIIGETYVRVQHALMALPGTRLADVRAVRSHPQALAQCSEFLDTLPNAFPVPWYDTAGAALSLAEGESSSVARVAAIASEHAASLYGLKILKRGIQNRARNYTRFLAIARPEKAEKLAPAVAAEGPHKTSLTFIPFRNTPGVLHAITGLFAERNIDLFKIESRPDPENAFDYRFYLDAAGAANASPLKEALAGLKALTREMQVLGSYPKAKLPGKTGR